MLKPQKNFRKASEASMGNRLGTNENDFDLFNDKPQTRKDFSKSQSRERYF